MENELGTMQKPPKLMNIDEYSGWSGRFKTWVQANHFECWRKIESKYVPPMNASGIEKALHQFTPLEQDNFKAEKKMMSILQQAIKEDILVLLQHQDNSQSVWNALKIKFLGSVSMIKSKTTLLKKEFDMFTGMKVETTNQLIERYCHLVVEMKRLSIEKTYEKWVDKLADALPYDEWGTYLLVLKNNQEYIGLNLSSFIEKIESHELELKKIRKMKASTVQQDVSLYYKGSSSVTSNLSPKIQTTFSADSTSPSTPSNNHSLFASFEPNTKVQSSPDQAYTQSSSGSNSQSQGPGILCNIAVNIKNGQEFTESTAKQHISLLASVLESYESLLAGRIGNPDMTKEDYDQIDPEELELIDIKWGMASLVRQAIYHKTSQQPFNQRPQIENKPEKALLVNQDDEKVAEGFSWDKYSLGDGLAMMAEIVEEPECGVETEDVSEVMIEESLADLEEAAAEVYYYQSKQEIIASSLKSIMPPNMFDSFAGFFSEPTTGFCPQYNVEKVPVEEIIDVSKEMNEETLKEIADKALMGKLKKVEIESVETEPVETESVENVSVKTESVGKKSDEKSEYEEIKPGENSESESDGFGKTDLKNDKEEKVSEKVDSIHEIPYKNCLTPCMDCYDTLARSIKMIQNESFENDKATNLLKATVMDKQMEINILLDKIASLKKELELMRIENERIDKKLINYVASSYVIDQIVPLQPDNTPVFKNGVEAALNLKLRTVENELPESIDVTFSPFDTGNKSQVIKTVVDQVLDEESDNSDFGTVKTQLENSNSDFEDEGNFLDKFIPNSDKVVNDDSIIVVYTMTGTDKLYSDFEYPIQNARMENVEKVFKLVQIDISEVNNNVFLSKLKKFFVKQQLNIPGKKEWVGNGGNNKRIGNNFKNKGVGFEKKMAKKNVKPKEKMSDVFVAGPSVDAEKDYIFSQKAVDDFNAAKKLREETNR
ncbi:uncharacterized protein LOC110919139 [Helianthus annuus]|uniref:uncharacterized protein LOC110919139 n=1 Tax=Helianthus annuus TaxID=4232 RepID=UPI000B8FAD2C|nr:uncharacterized protein LOC110919139 [Helianthus annuus]